MLDTLISARHVPLIGVLAAITAATTAAAPGSAGAQGRAPRTLATKPVEYAEPFSSVSRMVELHNGQVLLHDARERKLGAIDFGTGVFREVARIGAGPLEYRSVTALLRMPGDSVLLWDAGNARTMVLAPDARPVRTTPVADAGNPMAMVGQPMAREMDAAGRWYAYHRGMTIVGREMKQADSAAIVRVAPGSDRRDTLLMLRALSTPPTTISNGVMTTRALGFPSFDAWGVFPDGRVLVIHGDRYLPESVASDGTRRPRAAVPFTRVAVTAKDRSEYMERTRAQLGRVTVVSRAGSGAVPKVEVLEPEQWQSHKPPIESDIIRVDSRDRAWVRVTDADPEAGERYDLLDAEGRVVDAMRMPKGIKLVGMGKGVLYGTREDEDGLIYVRRYPLP